MAPFDFTRPISDKHIGNSHPRVENGERVNTGNEPVYGVLPASPNTLQQGIHPLTQPGITIPYFYDFYSASEHALHISEHADGTVGGLQVGITFLAKSDASIKNYTFDHLTMAGTGPVIPSEVAQVYMTVRNPETYETHTFDTTGLPASGYTTLMFALKDGVDLNQLSAIIEAVKGHETLHQIYQQAATLQQYATPEKQESLRQQREAMAHLRGDIVDARIERYGMDTSLASRMHDIMTKFTETLTGRAQQNKPAFDAQTHRENINQMITEFWNALNPTQRLETKYSEFHDKVTQVSKNADAQDALEAGAAWLRSQSTFLERRAITQALQSPEVQKAVSIARATQESKFDKVSFANLGDLLHDPSQQETPNDDRDDIGDDTVGDDH